MSFKYENTICHHGGIQQPPNDIDAEICMHETKTMRKLPILWTDHYISSFIILLGIQNPVTFVETCMGIEKRRITFD